MIRIVFVEDDAVQMANMRRSLSIMRRDWDMKFYSSATEALVGLAERKSDVIVADFEMPTVNGAELLAAVQQKFPHMVRVLLTEKNENERVLRAVSLAHKILSKPCDPAQLAIAIQRAFELEQRLTDPDLQSLISEVGNLPMPSRIVLQVSELVTEECCDINEVAEVVQQDINLTARLLQIVNSAYFNLCTQVTEVREAISYLGLDSVRNVCLAAEVLRNFEQVTPLVQSLVDEIHEHSVSVAFLAREMMNDRRSGNDAYIAGLLHDIGQLVIATKKPEKFLDLKVEVMHSNLPLSEIETEIIGARHSDIGALLLDLWGLPNHIVEAVARHHDASSVPTNGLDIMHAVHVADAIASGRLESSEDDWDYQNLLEDHYLQALGLANKVELLTLSSQK